mmetsp:Transcript_43644/g.64010  ORF Transcript_43644/g.64010 Transcript_43644/m.64010 type:complete len:234 (+) Transcript_43644:559-1260(+)
MYHGVSGMTLAIWLVLTGTSIFWARYPKKLPMKTSGVATQTHNKKRAKMVKKLTAVAAPAKRRKMSRNKNIDTNTPGKAVAVRMVFRFHAFAWKNLYRRLLQYPAMLPDKTYSMIIVVSICPLSMGDRNPNNERKMVNTMEAPICAPVPVATQRSMIKLAGGRKTSPCMSFHPLSPPSSNVSRSENVALYALISFFNERIMIPPNAAERKLAIMRAFTTENICDVSSDGLPSM